MIRKKYKFTEKTHSVRAVTSIMFSAVSLAGFIFTVWSSVEHAGSGSVYLGAVGLFALIAAAVGLYFAIRAVREEDTFRILPAVGTVLAVLTCGIWAAVYAAGFLL